ncbi:TIGR03943 family protein [Sporolactobacillus shoreicorticis]|uniref:TIGR03943 family putative permease subunit n=1 Tax=Sporolactobacillus shoreicorticis TaxID=1923877 RepID=A0ABW5RZX5_9BACL|nr:TIGR03943 family protein [Sporolactobacillus shoreicorticis]MCO7127619.1 TIGR03943 family protein [Sporolactobacillus shoreicorticis]
MNEQRLAFHHYLRGIALGGMALFLFRLALYGDLKYYLSPKLEGYTTAAIIVLALLSLIHLILPPDQHHHGKECGCGHEHEHAHPLPKKGLHSFIFFCLFFFPILTGFIFPNHTLGSDVAANRALKQASSVRSKTSHSGTAVKPAGALRNPISQKQFNALKKKLLSQKMITVDDAHYTYILNILEQNPNAFKGRQLTLTGFVYHDKQLPAHEIVTARFDISCCIADASVYGLRTKGAVANLKKDEWIRVRGTIDTVNQAGSRIPVLTKTQITQVKEPDHPYVYDNGVLLD